MASDARRQFFEAAGFPSELALHSGSTIRSTGRQHSMGSQRQTRRRSWNPFKRSRRAGVNTRDSRPRATGEVTTRLSVIRRFSRRRPSPPPVPVSQANVMIHEPGREPHRELHVTPTNPNDPSQWHHLHGSDWWNTIVASPDPLPSTAVRGVAPDVEPRIITREPENIPSVGNLARAITPDFAPRFTTREPKNRIPIVAPPIRPPRMSINEFLLRTPGRNPYANLYPFNRGRIRDNDNTFPGFQFERMLQPGGMSDAVSIVSKEGKLYVEKRMRLRKPVMQQRARSELDVLKIITEHSNRNLNYCISSLWGPKLSSLTLILEYCDLGSLDDKLEVARRHSARMPESFLWHLLQGLANGLAFLHSGVEETLQSTTPVQKDWRPIYHLDLKPSNVFLSSTGKEGPHPRIVIGDFGCAITGPVSQIAGTVGWDPPERKVVCGSAGDVWQAGAIVHACARLLPIPDRKALKVGKPCSKHYSESLTHVLAAATKENYRERLKATEIVVEAYKGMQSLKRR